MKSLLFKRIAYVLIIIVIILANFSFGNITKATTYVEALSDTTYKDVAATTADWDLDTTDAHLLNGAYRKANNTAGYETVSTNTITNPLPLTAIDGQPLYLSGQGEYLYASKWSPTLDAWSDLTESGLASDSSVLFLSGKTVDSYQAIKLSNGSFGVLANILIQGSIPGPEVTNLYYTQWTPDAGSAVCGFSGGDPINSCFTNAAGTTKGVEIISNQGLAYNTYESINWNETPNYHLVLDNYEQPSIIWAEKEDTTMNYYFTRWNGSNWTYADRTTIGKEKIMSETLINSAKIKMLYKGQELYVLLTAGYFSPFLAKWNGTNWQNLSGTNLTLPFNSTVLTKFKSGPVVRIMDLDFDHSGQLIVGCGGYTDNEGTYIARWQTTDNKWHYLDGTAINNIDNLTTLFSGNGLGYWGFSVDIKNKVLVWMMSGSAVASEIYFSQWNGTDWVKADGTTAGFEAASNVTNGQFLKFNSKYVLDNYKYPVFIFTQFNGSSPTSLLLSRYTGRSIKGGNKTTNAQDTAINAQCWYFGASYDKITDDVLMISQTSSSSSLYFTKFMEYIYPTNNQYLTSTTIATPINPGTQISKATLTASYNIPANTGLTFQMSANGGTNWDSVTPGVEWTFVNPGADLRWRALFTRTSIWTTAVLDYLLIDVDGKVANASGDVIISANIEPELSLNISPANCNFETFDKTTLKTCNYTSTVNTNGTNGYTAYVRAADDFKNAAGDIFTNITSGIGPNNSKIDFGYEEYGIATSDTDSLDITAKVADCASYNNGTTPMDAVAMTTNDQSFAHSNQEVSADAVTLCHAASISGITPAGVYSQTVFITVVSNY